MDLHLMEMSQVSFRDIEDAIAFENTSIAGGDVLIGDTRRMVRTSAEFTSAEEISNIIVKHEKGNIVYLKDIALVTDGYQDRESYARLNTQPVFLKCC